MNTADVGIDIAEASFVGALWLDEDRVTRANFDNSARGFARLQSWIRSHGFGHVRVGVESTNIYAQKLVYWLHAQGHTVYLLNAERTAQYAKCCGLRNKTDSSDADSIALYVAKHYRRLTQWHPPTEEQLLLRSLTRTRQQLVRQRVTLLSQVRTAHPAGQVHLRAVVDFIKQQIEQLERDIEQALERAPKLREQVERLTTIKGVGRTTAAIAIAELPPIESDSDPRSIAAWTGLTPRRRQSGKTEFPARLSRKGNCYLRDALFFPAITARRYNPLLARFADTLAANGKRPGVIAGAVAHKLIRIFVGLLRHKTNFDPNWSPPHHG